MNWHIGQEIVCIKTHSEGIVVKGKVYTIKGLSKPCCSINIDVGLNAYRPVTICTFCKTRFPSNGISWIGESLFAPLEYDQNAIEELLENTLVKTN